MFMKTLLIFSFILFLLLVGPLYLLFSGKVSLGKDWRTASRAPANVIPDRAIVQQAAIVLFSAPAFNWRGMFSTHTWIAVKSRKQTHFTIYQVIGWNRYRNKALVDVSEGIVDRRWFGAVPKLQGILVGKRAEALIPAVKRAVANYPYANTYRAWPGPNSNTFISYIIHSVPELHFVMPYNALGRDYRWQGSVRSLSLGGILGYHISHKACYLNLLGLTLGVSWKPLGFIIPGVGLSRWF